MARDTLEFSAKAGEKGLDADVIVHQRARKLCFERNKDPDKDFDAINTATIEVLKADPALGQAYKELRENCQ